VRETIFEFRPEEAPREYLLVEANKDGGAVITVRSLGGGRASIDLPVDQLADLGRKLLTRAAAFV
jgi:uridine phosphorylase